MSASLLRLIDDLLERNNFTDAAKILTIAIENNPEVLAHIAESGKHINYAHGLILAASWDLITALVPTQTNYFLTSGWLKSLMAGLPINNNLEPIPWYTYPAIDFLDGLIKPDWTVFEWGAGQSTLWWSNQVAAIISVEDDLSWFNSINCELPENVTLFYAEDQATYIEFIRSCKEQLFDVIIVDGNYRNLCIRVGASMLNEKGLIIVDNSDRTEFIDGLQHLENEGFYRLDFWGLIPSYAYKNCTSIFLKDPSILRSRPLPPNHVLSTGCSCAQAQQ